MSFTAVYRYFQAKTTLVDVFNALAAIKYIAKKLKNRRPADTPQWYLADSTQPPSLAEQ
jgi:hypothetical protein